MLCWEREGWGGPGKRSRLEMEPVLPRREPSLDKGSKDWELVREASWESGDRAFWFWVPSLSPPPAAFLRNVNCLLN